MTGNITSPILVAQHLRATFCKKEWLMEHVNAQINQVVVMYRSAEQVIRPPAPPDVSVCKGIMSCFSFLFLGVVRHYAKRPFSCWCKACSRVRGRGLGSQSRDSESREKGSRYCCEGAERQNLMRGDAYRLAKCGQLRRRLTCGLDTFGSASLGRFLVA
jgi:hypothetical protein